MNSIVSSTNFKAKDLNEISFVIDNMKYEFNNKYMQWKAHQIQVDDGQGDQDNAKKNKNKAKTIDQAKNTFEANEKEIQILKEKIKDAEEQIRIYKKKLEDSKDQQAKLMDEYVLEHLETEKVGNARIRLDNLKKELGL